ncbi:MAG: hypothetical protein ACN6OP_25925, partial [Pseudomonadales bacterium]
MKIKKLSLAISAILIAASVSTAFAGTINRVRIPTAGIKAPAGTVPTTPGLPTTPELPSMPTKPTEPPVEAHGFVISSDDAYGSGKTLTIPAGNSDTAVEGNMIDVDFYVTNIGNTKEAFNPAYTLLSDNPTSVVPWMSTCLTRTELEPGEAGRCKFSVRYQAW